MGRSVLVAAFIIGLIAAARAGAATIVVNTTNDELTAGDGQCSLREAIGTVDGGGNGDCTPATSGANTIQLGAQTYPLTLAGFLVFGGGGTACLSTFVPESSDNHAGELSVFGTVSDLTIEGAGPSQTVLDACRLGDRALEVKSGATVTLRGITITNGHARDGADGSNGGTFGSVGGSGNPGANGGGILNEGTLTLTDSAVTNSHAGDGGLGGQGGPLGGSGGVGGSGGNGGGIFSTGTLSLSATTVSGNSAGDGGHGGGGVLGSIANGQSGNGGSGGSGGNAGGGGGIANEVGTATIDTSTISGNHSGAGGGATGGQNSDSTKGNGGDGGSGGSGGNGAGIANAVNATLQATNDTIEGNVAGAGADGKAAGSGANDTYQDGHPGAGGNGGSGGGLLNVHSTAHLVNLTIAANSASAGGSGGPASNSFPAGANGSDGHGGGLFASSSSPTLQNTLLYENQTGGDCRGTITDGGHNLVFALQVIGPMPPDPCNVSNFSTSDPRLASLADNGGPTQTMRLQPGSGAIDQVPSSGAGCPAADQRGVVRPGGPACDIGAYEVAPPQATTGPASQISSTAATISATVIANAADATVTFQYGTSTTYGSSTAQQHATGSTSASMLGQLAALKPATTYHYRVVASSVDGTAVGSDATFNTAPLKSSSVRLKRLKIKPRRVHRRRGAKVTYTDSVASSTHFVLSRCTKFVKKRCKHFRRVRSFTHHDVAGRNSFHLRVKKLPLGLYRLAATPRLDRVRGKTVQVTFHIVG
jgi:CSLREA domain-containing protein